MDVRSMQQNSATWIDRAKVPVVITLVFWIIKILATTVGETAADFLAVDLHFGLGGTSWVMGGLLALTLAAQMRARRYIPWLYWLTVVLVSVVGTLLTDNITDHAGVPLDITTTLFALALLAIFIAWYARENTLSIHSIYTARREAFYWAAILFTFALGTAAGDLAAERLQWGYAHSALLFGAALGVVAVAHFGFKVNAVAAFWAAYILTRPFGATCGDWLSKSAAEGGLGLGTVATSALFLLVIAGLVLYLTLTRRDAAPGAVGTG